MERIIYIKKIRDAYTKGFIEKLNLPEDITYNAYLKKISELDYKSYYDKGIEHKDLMSEINFALLHGRVQAEKFIKPIDIDLEVIEEYPQYKHLLNKNETIL